MRETVAHVAPLYVHAGIKLVQIHRDCAGEQTCCVFQKKKKHPVHGQLGCFGRMENKQRSTPPRLNFHLK